VVRQNQIADSSMGEIFADHRDVAITVTSLASGHRCDGIYSSVVDGAVAAMGLTVLKTPVRCPQASAFCERLIMVL
jgi:hypothetical protein